MKYSFGFSWVGFLIVSLPMLPNFFYFIFPNTFSSVEIEGKHVLLDILEHGSQFIFIALLIFVVTSNNISISSSYVTSMVVILLSYYVLWILLFAGYKNLLILICLAVFPVIYFILAEIWLRHFIAIIPTAFFGIVHIIITYIDFYSSH